MLTEEVGEATHHYNILAAAEVVVEASHHHNALTATEADDGDPAPPQSVDLCRRSRW